MRPLLLAVVVCGCGGGSSPELYRLVADFATAPASCFATPPNTTVSMGPLGTSQVEVWDGPEAKAYLSMVSGGLNVDMGDAPTVTVVAGQALEGTSAATGWTFATDRTTTTTQIITNAMVVTKTHAAITFPRATTGKGTLSLSSSQTCTGTGCPTAMPACAIDGIVIRSTRLQVDYEKTP